MRLFVTVVAIQNLKNIKIEVECSFPKLFEELISTSVIQLTFVGFALLIIVVWLPNMKKKDASLSRYPEFEEYKNKSGMFFPKVIWGAISNPVIQLNLLWLLSATLFRSHIIFCIFLDMKTRVICWRDEFKKSYLIIL